MDRTSHPPTTKELRQFGLLVGGVFGVIGLWPIVFRSESPRWWALMLGSLLILLAASAPQSLKQVHSGWMQVGQVLGAINTKIILGIIYYFLITPMGLSMRLLGKDPMHRTLTQGTNTYRVVRAPRPRQHMRHQF
jgi:hypothetical protein